MSTRTPMMISSFLLVSCMAVAPPPASSAKSVRLQTSIAQMGSTFLYLATEDALQNHNPALAIRFLAALVDKDPSAVIPRIQLAELLLQHSQVKQARKQVDALLAMPSGSPQDMEKIQLIHAQILAVSNKRSDAIQILQQALQKQPNTFTTRMMLIHLMEREERFDEAHQIIHDGIKSNPNLQLYHIDAELYIRQGKLKKATQTLETLRKLAPDQSGPVLMLSRLDLRQGNITKAEILLRTFLAKHPHATEQQIRQGLNGNLCRCGTYANVVQAALALVRGAHHG